MSEDIVDRLRIRASIRRNNKERKSVTEGKPDRISDLLEEAANEIEKLRLKEAKQRSRCDELLIAMVGKIEDFKI